jgi:hypothetical protein
MVRFLEVLLMEWEYKRVMLVWIGGWIVVMVCDCDRKAGDWMVMMVVGWIDPMSWSQRSRVLVCVGLWI